MAREPTSTLVELTERLVAIDSINPDLISGAAGEAAVAGEVAEWCERAGLEVQLEEPAPGRPNVVARARGTGGGKTLLLNAHMDTVGVAGMDEPFLARLENGRLHGRGAYDMKGALAAIMVAGAEAAKRGLRGDVIVAAVADEEVASLGTQALVETVEADAAIVAEPTELRVCVAHKGFAGFEIEVDGKAAHGSRPELGVDAIARMGHVLVRLEKLDARLRASAAHSLLGTGSVHGSLIEGGQEFSSYPARCLLTGERRTVPGESREVVEGEVRELLGDLDGQTRLLWVRPPLETPPSEPIVQLVLRHAGGDEPGGVPFWADSALLSGAGIPTVLFGPAGEGAHAVVEWVDVASLERCVEVYVAVAEEFCA
jgi:acetylornithine deacetylase/succinyl-diaminopimelate desuccinylase-like protein